MAQAFMKKIGRKSSTLSYKKTCKRLHQLFAQHCIFYCTVFKVKAIKILKVTTAQWKWKWKSMIFLFSRSSTLFSHTYGHKQIFHSFKSSPTQTMCRKKWGNSFTCVINNFIHDIHSLNSLKKYLKKIACVRQNMYIWIQAKMVCYYLTSTYDSSIFCTQLIIS